MKIAVIGYSGSGKSTLAKELAQRYGCRPLYLDTVNFLPDWRERDRNEARSRVQMELEKTNWVIDGNYRSMLHAERMEQADQIVWMNYTRVSCLARALKRYVSFHGKTRESAADGCIERMTWEFVWWILYKGRTQERVRGYRDLVARYPEKMVVIRNDRERGTYIAGLDRRETGQA